MENMKFRLATPSPSCICKIGDNLFIADIHNADLIIFSIKDKTVIRKMTSTAIRPKLIMTDRDFVYVYDEVFSNINRIDLNTEYSHPFGGFSRANHPYYGLAVDDEKFFVLSPDIPWYPSRKLKISVYDKHSKVFLDSFDAPTYGSRGLYSNGTCLHTMDYQRGIVYIMDINTGIVIDEQIMPAKHLLDIAADEDNFYTIDTNKNCILGYAKSHSKYDLYGDAIKSEITLGEVYINEGPESIVDWQVALSVPESYMHQKITHYPVISPKTNQYLFNYWPGREHKTPFIHLNDLTPGNSRIVKVSFEAETRDLRFHLDPARCQTFDDIPGRIKEEFLFSEQMKNANAEEKLLLESIDKTYQFTNKKVKQEAEKIVGDEKNLLLMVLKIFKHVIKEIKYSLPYQSIPILKVIEEKKGSCGNHNALLTSFCQSLGFPTRAIIGFCIWENDARACYLDHVITEVYIPPYGFVPMDTSRFMSIPNYSGLIGDDFMNFGRLDKRFIVNGFIGVYNTEYAKFQGLNKKKITSKGHTKTGYNFFVDWKTINT